MQLTPSQQKSLNIERHVSVTAGAGSGKTTVLVDRYLEILRREGVRPQEIVAITFTEKAAAEMKERVVEKLNTEPGIANREKFLEQMNTAPISTIHAFCSRILREFPFQAGVPANFNVLQGIDQKISLQRVLRETLKEIATDPQHEHRGPLARLLKRYGGRQKLEDLLSTMIERRDVVARLIKDVYSDPPHTQLPDVWKQILGAGPNSENRDDCFLLRTTRDLLTVYDRISEDYQTAKLSQGTLDFNDLQLRARDLLRSHAEIRQTLIDRYAYYMVDEYQDTNELQHELVMLLTDDLKAANLFIVGDPKQSIYGFRGSDVRVFRKAEQKISDEGGTAISLKENFRSLHSVIAFVNYFFDRSMGDGSESPFEVPYESLIKARRANTEGAVQILLGRPGDETASESARIANHINTMMVEGARGTESGGSIAYGDIAILIRSRTHLPDIEHALLEAGIPYLTTGGIGFYQRQEIYDIWNYLNFLDAPEKNQTALVGVLRGPAFGISDAELYEIVLQKETSFWEKTQTYQAPSDNLKHAIETLKRHIQIAHRMPVNRLVLTIVNETGMIGTLKTGKQGQQRWANYQKLLELARNFDGDENSRILSEFIEFLDVLITEEPREGQAPVDAGSGAVQIMTIHAAKGLQFPVVLLPCLDRGGQSDREPFIDERLGIGFSPLNPKEGYRKTEPRIVSRMKDLARQKRDAESKRLFYVGATRARDRLVLSGTLPARGKLRGMLEWLETHLGIGEEGSSLNLPFKLEVFSDNSEQFEEPAAVDRTSAERTPVEFPESVPFAPGPTEIPAAFSVSELANYARCPLRYQLENVLRIPANGDGEMDSDETDMDAAVRYTLSRVRREADVADIDILIDQTSKNYPEIADGSEGTLRTHVNNFFNSGLGATAFEAAETRTNQQIYADINGHIVEGRFDRLFKDETEDWQVVIYKTGEIQNLDTYYPEMELDALLLHRRYPDQSVVTINLFFTQNGQSEQRRFSTAELQEGQERWQKETVGLQRGSYEKNLDHCCSCPYADPDGACIIITEV